MISNPFLTTSGSEYAKRHRAKKIKNGLCARSGCNKISTGKYYCNDCLDKQKKERQEIKFKAFMKIGRGKIECVCGCGCKDIRFLEINHKNGGGRIEFKNGTYSYFKRNIVSGKRLVDDLELTCAPYNALHKMMIQYGLTEAPFRITFLGEKKNAI